MGDSPRRAAQKDTYVAIIDQETDTDEVRNIAVIYDPFDRVTARFHLTEDGERHIDDENVIVEHKIFDSVERR